MFEFVVVVEGLGSSPALFSLSSATLSSSFAFSLPFRDFKVDVETVSDGGSGFVLVVEVGKGGTSGRGVAIVRGVCLEEEDEVEATGRDDEEGTPAVVEEVLGRGTVEELGVAERGEEDTEKTSTKRLSTRIRNRH